MRYIVAIASAVVVLFLLSVTTGFGDWPRPWGSLSRGAVGGIVCVGILIIWEQMSPSPDRDMRAEPEAGLHGATTPERMVGADGARSSDGAGDAQAPHADASESQARSHEPHADAPKAAESERSAAQEPEDDGRERR